MRSILRHDPDYCYSCPLYKDERKCSTYIPTDVYYSEVKEDGTTPIVDVLVVGEPPSSSEDRIGFPFAGAAGSDLKRALSRAGVDNYAVMNCIRCRGVEAKGKRRVPSIEEISACKNYLLKDIEMLSPKVIVLAGTLPVQMIGTDPAWRGKTAHALKGHVHTQDGVTQLVTISPNYYIRSENAVERRRFYRNIEAIRQILTGEETKWSREGEVRLISTLGEFDELMDFLQFECSAPISCDTESKNLNKVAHNKLATVQFSYDPDLAFTIPVDHWDTPFKDKKDRIYIKKRLRKLFSDPNTKFPFWVMHNSPFDTMMALRHLKLKRQPPKLVICTQFLSYLEDENQAGEADSEVSSSSGYNAFRLKDLVREHLHFYLYDTKLSDAMAARSGASGGSLWDLDLNTLSEYAGTDAYVTLRLFKFYRKLLKRQGYGSALKFAHRWYGRASYPLMRMSVNGFKLDQDQLGYLKSSESPIISRLDVLPKLIYGTKEAKRANEILLRNDSHTKGMRPLFGKDPWLLDISKKSHRVHLFVDSCGLEPLGYGKDGTPSINKQFFDTYKSNELVSLYQEYSGLYKLSTSYLNSVTSLLANTPDNAIDGKIRASFHLIRTVTGRGSSSNPNLQQLPKGKGHTAKAHIRSLYGVDIGRMILEADYGQAEVRWWAQISGDKEYAALFHEMKRLRDLYKETGDLELGKKVAAEADIHKKVAGIMFKKSVYDVTSADRKKAKSLCFACIFGQHFKTLASLLGISPEEALDLQDTFVREFARAGAWLSEIEVQARQTGMVATPMGRVRHLSDIYAKNEGAGDRRARNSPIQAASSDTTVLAAWRMQDIIDREKLPFKLINFVHDAITLDIPLDFDCLNRGISLMETCMVDIDDFMKDEFGIDMIVPMEIDFDLGVRWGHLLNYDGVKSNLRPLFNRCSEWDRRLAAGEKWHVIANEEWTAEEAA